MNAYGTRIGQGHWFCRSRAAEVEATDWTAVKRFDVWGKGRIGATVHQQGQQCAVQPGQIDQPVGVATARDVLAHPPHPMPIIADSHPRPTATDELAPRKQPPGSGGALERQPCDPGGVWPLFLAVRGCRRPISMRAKGNPVCRGSRANGCRLFLSPQPPCFNHENRPKNRPQSPSNSQSSQRTSTPCNYATSTMPSSRVQGVYKGCSSEVHGIFRCAPDEHPLYTPCTRLEGSYG